jgi:hypothetical protein
MAIHVRLTSIDAQYLEIQGGGSLGFFGKFF